ncbi:ankyrin-3-like [Phymastichus coffea]|uniref:ankyrin-3-like n=1 Tax=Phymastichus coffea TaxID=108790 RepID=UPI00273B1D47|nr:ankyrin-3-like [Phymastichus coffea]
MTSTYQDLFESLVRDDVRTFRGILEAEGLPRGTGYDLLIKAVKLNRKRIVTYLLHQNCCVFKPKATSTPLHLAVEKLGWCKIVKKMLELGAKVTDVNAHGDTVLHVAFKNHASDFVIDLLLKTYLTETTVDVFDKDNLGFMHIACTRSNIDIVKEFFDTGKANMYGQVNLDCATEYAGYTPLHFAVKYGRHEMTKFLCMYEAEMYIQDSKGSTPIHLALEKRDVKMIDIISYYDSQHINYVNDAGLTHFMAACAVGDANLIEQYLHIASLPHSGTSSQSLLSGRVRDVGGYEFSGYTPLHFAAEFGHYAIVEGLLKMGALPSVPTTSGLTPLALAEREQNVHICWLFMQLNVKY